jgi:hypothetical protein
LAPAGFEIVLRGIRSVQAQSQGRLTLIGSAADCQVRLLDPGVSNYHCAMVHTPSGLWVVDLMGQGGTAVNGEKVRSAPWMEADEVKVGRSTIRLRTAAAAVANTARAANGTAAGTAVARRPQASSPAAAALGTKSRPSPEASDSHPGAVSQHDASKEAPASPRVPARNERRRFSDQEDGDQPEAEAHSRRRPIAPEARLPSAPPADQREVDDRTTVPPGSADLPRSRPERSRPRRDVDAGPDRRSAWKVRKDSGVAGRRDAKGGGATRGQPEAPERRSSCRYAVSDTFAQLAWWKPASAEEFESRPKLAESCTYTALMARGPGFRNGALSPREAAEVRRETAAPQEFVRSCLSRVRLVDVSQSGLSVLGGEAPPHGQRSWLRLETSPTPEWVEVSLVGTKPAEGASLIRLAFRDSCPYDMFKALVIEGRVQRD